MTTSSSRGCGSSAAGGAGDGDDGRRPGSVEPRALYPRLKPGPKRSPEAAAAHQRARLHAAMIEACDRKGYAATTASEITTLAGVSKKTLYRYFGSKDECFLATYDLVVRQAVGRISAAYRGEGGRGERDWSRGPLSRFRCVRDGDGRAARRPSRLALIDVLAVAPAAADRIARAEAIFTTMISTSLAQAARRDRGPREHHPSGDRRHLVRRPRPSVGGPPRCDRSERGRAARLAAGVSVSCCLPSPNRLLGGLGVRWRKRARAFGCDRARADARCRGDARGPGRTRSADTGPGDGGGRPTRERIRGTVRRHARLLPCDPRPTERGRPHRSAASERERRVHGRAASVWRFGPCLPGSPRTRGWRARPSWMLSPPVRSSPAVEPP